MKNIFIGGVAKSGKSTLAKKLCKDEKYNHIPVDYFTASFKRNYPDVGIVSNVVVNEETSAKLSLFLSTVIGIIDTTDEKFIIDSAHIMPNDIVKYIDRDKWGGISSDTKDLLELTGEIEKKKNSVELDVDTIRKATK